MSLHLWSNRHVVYLALLTTRILLHTSHLYTHCHTALRIAVVLLLRVRLMNDVTTAGLVASCFILPVGPRLSTCKPGCPATDAVVMLPRSEIRCILAAELHSAAGAPRHGQNAPLLRQVEAEDGCLVTTRRVHIQLRGSYFHLQETVSPPGYFCIFHLPLGDCISWNFPLQN